MGRSGSFHRLVCDVSQRALTKVLNHTGLGSYIGSGLTEVYDWIEQTTDHLNSANQKHGFITFSDGSPNLSSVSDEAGDISEYKKQLKKKKLKKLHKIRVIRSLKAIRKKTLKIKNEEASLAGVSKKIVDSLLMTGRISVKVVARTVKASVRQQWNLVLNLVRWLCRQTIEVTRKSVVKLQKFFFEKILWLLPHSFLLRKEEHAMLQSANPTCRLTNWITGLSFYHMKAVKWVAITVCFFNFLEDLFRTVINSVIKDKVDIPTLNGKKHHTYKVTFFFSF
nr:PREDICTED: uncharacterized protein LOC102363333 [Latimeria chalumnae]XP_006003905.1 PREDICTED: uncharacterized protein LOC102363333 [Latimeria chalumnae]|eukprot:XP_006003904.1 PREDICTED: uncharacterized protein LOC102363333 [Latimeria chalumnae]